MSIPGSLAIVAHFLVMTTVSEVPPGISRHAYMGVYPGHHTCMLQGHAFAKLRRNDRVHTPVIYQCLTEQELSSSYPQLLAAARLDATPQKPENRRRSGTNRHSSCLSTGHDPGHCASRPGFSFGAPDGH